MDSEQIIKWTIVIEDDKRKKARTVLYTAFDVWPPDSSPAAFAEQYRICLDYVRELCTRLDAIIKGRIVSVTGSFVLTVTGLKTYADLDSDIEEKARFSYTPTGSDQGTYAHELPAFDHSVFPAGVEEMDPAADVDLNYYATLIWHYMDAADWSIEQGYSANGRGETLYGTRARVYKVFRRS